MSILFAQHEYFYECYIAGKIQLNHSYIRENYERILGNMLVSYIFIIPQDVMKNITDRLKKESFVPGDSISWIYVIKPHHLPSLIYRYINTPSALLFEINDGELKVTKICDLQYLINSTDYNYDHIDHTEMLDTYEAYKTATPLNVSYQKNMYNHMMNRKYDIFYHYGAELYSNRGCYEDELTVQKYKNITYTLITEWMEKNMLVTPEVKKLELNYGQYERIERDMRIYTNDFAKRKKILIIDIPEVLCSINLAKLDMSKLSITIEHIEQVIKRANKYNDPSVIISNLISFVEGYAINCDDIIIDKKINMPHINISFNQMMKYIQSWKYRGIVYQKLIEFYMRTDKIQKIKLFYQKAKHQNKIK